MKLGTVGRSAGAGMVVYVVMAACSATEKGAPPGLTTKKETPTADSSADTSTSGGMLDAFVDALANPVSDAKADIADFDVSTVNCDKTSGNVRYAEKDYPGISATELAHVAALVDGPTQISGYTKAPYPLSGVKDGAVAVVCGAASAPAITSVTFVRRK